MARITFSIEDEVAPLIDDRAGERHPSVSSYIAELVTNDLRSSGRMPGSPGAENARIAAELSRDPSGAQIVAKHLRRAANVLGKKAVAA